MHIDIATLLIGMTVCMITMAVVLPAVMGQVSRAARCAQAGVVMQAAGWSLLLASGLAAPGSLWDLTTSTLAMAGIAGGLALNAVAFDLWCGRPARERAPAVIAIAMPIGYAIGFSNYAFRVGWANGLLTVQLALVAMALWRRPEVTVGRWRYLLMISLVAQMLVTAGRGLLGAFFTDSYPDFLAPHPVNLAFALMANTMTTLSLVAILLAHRDDAARELQRLATEDGLTGVLNRRAWVAAATTALSVGERYGHQIAVLMIDLDHFKRINDALGHEAGDRALAFVARALRAAVRSGDLGGRYGGEEFCVLMTHADLPAAIAFDARMRAFLGEAAKGELGFELNYSAGIATREQADDDLAAMLKRADDNLYAAKHQGRARTMDTDGISVHDTITRNSGNYAVIAAATSR